MDEKRFDQIAKTLGSQKTRRATLKGIGLGLLGAAGWATGLEVEAKGKGKGKHHRVNDPLQTICVPDVGGDCTSLPCCTGLDCESDNTCQCHLGACQHNSECTCASVETCGTFGDTTGLCCRTTIGIYCNADLSEVGSQCCAPAYICDPHGAGCQCNTDAGFVNNNGTCECPAGQHVNDAGQCVADETCVALHQTCNACHQCCASDGSVCTDPNHACDGSGGTCECPAGTHESAGKCVPDTTCIQPGQTCNACHQCCEGSTCTDPNHACDGSGGTCCLNNGQQGNTNHPDLCCSGCVCPDGNCCDASHCQQPQCDAPLVPCGTDCINPDTQCCAEDAIGVICPPDPRGHRKCCPAGHTCNPNKNGTYNCGLGNGVQSRHGARSRNRKRT